MTSAKAGAAATTAAVLAALLHVAGSGASYFISREGLATDNEVLDVLLVRRFGEFAWPLGPRGDDLWLPFLVGVALTALLVFGLVLALGRSLASGSGSFAVFLGTWFGVLVATVAAKAAWTALAAEPVMGSHTFPGWWTSNIQSGAWWGLLFGWIPAAAAAIAFAVANRGQRAWGYAREGQQLGAPRAAPPAAPPTWSEPQDPYASPGPAQARPPQTASAEAPSLFTEPPRSPDLPKDHA